MSDTRAVTTWPSVTALREQFAAQVSRTAERRRADCGSTVEETYVQVHAAAREAVEEIAAAALEAAEMALDLWAATQ